MKQFFVNNIENFSEMDKLLKLCNLLKRSYLCYQNLKQQFTIFIQLKLQAQTTFLIKVQLTHTIILVSDVQNSDLIFVQVIVHVKLFKNIGPIPCAIQYIFVSYSLYT